MSGYFFDTSALVKTYHSEIGTAKVDFILNEPNATHFVSRLCVVEAQSVFAGKVRTGVIADSEFQRLRRKFFADLTKRRFNVVHMLVSHYAQAGSLLRGYATTRSLRTLDALQLSVALSLRDKGLIDHFICADRGLCAVALTEGLSVIDPEQP